MKKLLVTMGGMLILFGMVSGGCSGQEPAEVSVISEEVSWKIDDTTVYATITRPDTGKNRPAVVFIPGSGPTDRDWNSPLLPGKNGSAALLAERLAAEGYVTLRYDKRFAGTHAAENTPLLFGKISMQGHLDELSGAVNLLAGKNYVDGRRIFALANSEGTIHAVNYQMQEAGPGFAGMILTGAPGRTTGDLAHSQIKAQLAGYPGAEAVMKLYDEAVAGFLADGVMTPDESLPEGIKVFLQSLALPVNMPFTQELWMADIAPDLKEIDVPVLIIIGRKDIQVDWEVDGGKLKEAAAGKQNIEFVFPENANHVLKHEPKPKEEINLTAPNYNGADTVLDEDTLSMMTEWLKDHS